MKKMVSHVIVFVTAIVLLQSCSKEVLRGEGPVVTEARQLQPFRKISVSGNRHAEIIISNESKVEIKGYQNLVGVYRSDVVNGELRFEYPVFSRIQNDNITLKIYTPRAEALKMSGHTEVVVGNGLQAASFEADISGQGILRMQGGDVNSLSFFTSGDARIYAEAVASRNATVNMSGNGRVELRSSETLHVNISGNAEVHYWGNPTVHSVISGNGKTIRH